ncbi:MAG: hypothetical protein ABI164_10020, partial [Acidobacteriaceae bacterium]
TPAPYGMLPSNGFLWFRLVLEFRWWSRSHRQKSTQPGFTEQQYFGRKFMVAAQLSRPNPICSPSIKLPR